MARKQTSSPRRTRLARLESVGVVLALGVFTDFRRGPISRREDRAAIGRDLPATPQATMKQIGNTLMQRYALPLEVIGLMLTAALIGAVILAMKENQAPR